MKKFKQLLEDTGKEFIAQNRRHQPFDDAMSKDMVTHAPVTLRGVNSFEGGHDVQHFGINRINNEMLSRPKTTSLQDRAANAILNYFSPKGSNMDEKIRNSSLPLEIGGSPMGRDANLPPITKQLSVKNTSIGQTGRVVRHTVTLDATPASGSGSYRYDHAHVGEAIERLARLTGLQYHAHPDNSKTAKKGEIKLFTDLTHHALDEPAKKRKLPEFEV